MPYTNIYIHLIWATKNRLPLLNTKAIRSAMKNHIWQNCKKNHIHLIITNCVEDHIHLLISLGREQTLSKTVQLIKGESSAWINKSNLLDTHFAWQREYMGISISHTHIERVKDYIAGQEIHHSTNPTESEFDYFSNKYGFEKFDFE